MIRQLKSTDIDDLSKIASSLKKVMGQQMTPEKQWHLQSLIIDYCRNPDSPMKVFGWFSPIGVLTSAIFIHYSPDVNAWVMVMLMSNSTGADGGYACLKLIKHAQNVGRQLGFYQYYTVVETSRERAYHDTFIKKVRSDFLYAVDELVPAKERPVTNLYWDWLFNNKTKELDVSIVHHWLPAEFRNKPLSSANFFTKSNDSEKQN